SFQSQALLNTLLLGRSSPLSQGDETLSQTNPDLIEDPEQSALISSLKLVIGSIQAEAIPLPDPQPLPGGHPSRFPEEPTKANDQPDQDDFDWDKPGASDSRSTASASSPPRPSAISRPSLTLPSFLTRDPASFS